MSDYKALTDDVNQALGKMGKEAGNVLSAFQQLAKASQAGDALDLKTKELIALAIGIATHCQGCIGFHTKKLVSLGVSKDAFYEMLGVAVYMGGGPSLMYAAEAIQAFEQFGA